MSSVSVVIPTYNRGHVLPRAIESVLAQTYSDVELIIIDDGSTDETERVVSEYREAFDRMTYHRHDSNRGLAVARNTGIDIADGDYITFLDSDDEFHPDLLETSVRTLSELPQEYAGTYVAYELHRNDEPPEVLGVKPELRSVETFENWDRAQARMGGTLLRLSVFRDVGTFTPGLTYIDDYEFWLRLLGEYGLVGIERALYRYYMHDDQIIASEVDLIRGLEQLLAERRELLPPRHEARFRYKLGHAYARNDRMDEASTEFAKAIEADPNRVMNYYYYVAAKLHPVLFSLPLGVATLVEKSRGLWSELRVRLLLCRPR